jgi:hypothetical protein
MFFHQTEFKFHLDNTKNFIRMTIRLLFLFINLIIHSNAIFIDIFNQTKAFELKITELKLQSTKVF